MLTKNLSIACRKEVADINTGVSFKSTKSEMLIIKALPAVIIEEDFKIVKRNYSFDIHSYIEEVESRKVFTFHIPSIELKSSLYPSKKGPGLIAWAKKYKYNLYIYPQRLRGNYVSAKAYFSMPKEERYKYCCKPQTYENSWKEKELKAKIRYYENKGWNTKKLDLELDKVYAEQNSKTRNPFCNLPKACAEDTFTYRTIVLDLDCHDEGSNIKAECEYVLNEIKARDIIKPSQAVFTGRGLQLWFNFDEVYKTLRWKVNIAKDKLISVYENFLTEIESYLELDRIASNRLEGMFRLPGSFNFSALKEVEVIYTNDHSRTLNDILCTIGEEKVTVKKSSSKRNPKTIKPHVKPNKEYKIEYSNERLELYKSLALSEAGAGKRDILLHLATVEYVSMGVDALRMALEFNQLFAMPLSYSDVYKVVKCDQRKHYKYKDETIDNLLGFAYLYKKDNKKNKKKKNTKKVQRNCAILRLHLKGYSNYRIAKELNISHNTVKKILDKLCKLIKSILAHKNKNIINYTIVNTNKYSVENNEESILVPV